MKLLRLELAAFGPFRDRFEIDFTSFDADGIYLIAGPTGAGKSSILDAVTFALYGSAPRYDGRAHLRSDLAGPEQATWVEIELAVGDRVLRVRRSPEYERPKQRGTGTTKEKASAQLLERGDDGWVAIATSVAEVGAEVGRILGLTKEEFLQVILLAQGGFAKFLSASSDDRKLLLQRLFGTGSMRRLRELLLADAKAVGDVSDALERTRDERGRRVLDAATPPNDETAESTPDAAGAEIAAIDQRIDEPALAAASARLDARVRTAEQAALSAERAEREARAAHDAAKTLADRFARREAGAAELARLERASAAIDADRSTLADADRAAEAASALDRWHRADSAAETAAAAAASATLLLPEGVGADGASVEAEHQQAVDAVASATAAVALEATLPTLERESDDAAAAAASAERIVATAKAQRAEAPAAREAIARAREAATALAAGLVAAERAVESASQRLEARTSADALAVPLRAASEAASQTVTAHAAAAAEAQRLQRSRIAGIAGELAADLVAGEACPVCGALEHPDPHGAADDAVSADDVAAALAASDAAASAAREANAELGALERQLASLEGSAGAADRSTLAAALKEAQREQQVCADAVVEVERRTEQLREHDLAASGLEASITEFETTAAAARTAAAQAATRLIDARDRLTDAMGDHESARALRTAEKARAQVLRAWLDADASRIRAESERVEAAEAGDDALSRHSLPDRQATVAMLLDTTHRTALRQRIRTHDDAVARATGVLAQADVVALAGEAPDVAPVAAALDEATTTAAAAARTATAAATTRDAVATDLAAAREAIRALADGAEHAVRLRALSSALDGKNERRQDIETYVLATRLGAIIEAANLRLSVMTDDRFALLHDEATAYRGVASGLGIQVLDAHTGVPRTAKSLSGGETFLASLALALGLADVVHAESGGVSLETLFVDEGFGSLDQDTLEAALATLDDLRAGGRSVGVISHVQQMQERIPARITVVPVPGGGSRILVTASDQASV